MQIQEEQIGSNLDFFFTNNLSSVADPERLNTDPASDFWLADLPAYVLCGGFLLRYNSNTYF